MGTCVCTGSQLLVKDLISSCILHRLVLGEASCRHDAPGQIAAIDKQGSLWDARHTAMQLSCTRIQAAAMACDDAFNSRTCLLIACNATESSAEYAPISRVRAMHAQE